MNKSETIKRINNFGKVGRIITLIMMIVVGLSMLGTFGAAIVLKVFPDDIVTLNIGTQAEMTISPMSLSPDIPVSELETIVDHINEGTIKGGLNLGVARLTMNSARLEDNKIVATTSGELGQVSLDTVSLAVLMAGFALVLTTISIVFGFLLCRAFEKCESPFEEKVIQKMRYFAFSLIPWALYSSVPNAVLNRALGNNLEIGLSLDMNVIFAVLVILALTIVFKYGAILQQESDETL